MVFAVSGLVAMAVMLGTLGMLAVQRTPGARRLYQSALYSVLAVMLLSAVAYASATGNIDITLILLCATLGLYFIARPNLLPTPATQRTAPTIQAGLSEMRARKAAQPKRQSFVDTAGRTFALRTAEKDGTLTISVFTTDDAPTAIGYVDLTLARDYGESRATLTDIFVRDEYRQAGIAAYLLGAAERAARERGATKIVGQSNDIRLWARQPGWQVEDSTFYRNI